jgi:hypothetical protein
MNIIIKECSKHGATKHTSRKDRPDHRCRKCAVEAVQRRREKIKLDAIAYKGGKCVKCGYNKCVAALEFHHINPALKEFGMGQNGATKSWATIKQELDKCILLCANCHREIHSQ